MKPNAKLSLALVFAIAIISCSTGSDSVEEPAKYRLAAEQNVDSKGLENAYDLLSANPDTRALIVERNGIIVQEEYFNSVNAEDYFDIRSVTKSVMSILIGIAVDKGYITSVNDPIGKYLSMILPDLEASKAAITIKQLLTMSSGLPWLELGSSTSDFSAWVSSSDQLRWILNKPFEYSPGTHWNYNTGASHVLSAILAASSEFVAKQFAQNYLLGPMDATVGNWNADSRGNNFGGHGIYMRPKDMIKIGRMMMNGGVYNGNRIVSSSWVQESTTQYFNTNYIVTYGEGYGYLWWKGRDSNTGLTFTFAHGYGGQFIIYVPARNTIIAAVTSYTGLRNPNTNWNEVITTIVGNIFPALKSN